MIPALIIATFVGSPKQLYKRVFVIAKPSKGDGVVVTDEGDNMEVDKVFVFSDHLEIRTSPSLVDSMSVIRERGFVDTFPTTPRPPAPEADHE